MKTFITPLSEDLISYPIELIGKPEELLFLDIETTGFAAKGSVLYMIGCVFFEEGKPKMVQYFAEAPAEEKTVLSAFLSLCLQKSILIHYNGNNFDIPYLKHKCEQFGLAEPFGDMTGVDIYKRIMPYKRLLHVDNLKQKTMEIFLGIEREDAYNGGELINIYREYVPKNLLIDKDEAQIKDMEELLLLHNGDDMRGMLRLLSLVAYSDLFINPPKITRVSAKKISEPGGEMHQTLLIHLRLKSPLPKDLSISTPACRFEGFENEGILEIPIFSGELKYFYSDHKDYYYLPEEDMALHKSVASYVSPDFRQQATAENCYTRKEGLFLPQWDLLFEPVFKKEYKDPVLYFELTNELKKRPDEFRKYALHVLDYLFHKKN